MDIRVKPLFCPKCYGEIGSQNGKYICKECDRVFDDDDVAAELDKAHAEYMAEKEKAEKYLVLMNELFENLKDWDSCGDEVEYISVSRTPQTEDAVRQVCEMVGLDFDQYLNDYAEGGEGDEIDIAGLWAPDMEDMRFSSTRGFYIERGSDKEATS